MFKKKKMLPASFLFGYFKKHFKLTIIIKEDLLCLYA